MLTRQHGLTYYKCDDHFDSHLRQGIEAGKPVCAAVQHGDMDFVFLREHEQNVKLAWDVFSEEFEFVIRDLEKLPKPLLAEGAVLLPSSLRALAIAPERAFYLLPREAFFRGQYAKRAWARERALRSTDPPRAFENWMRRDVSFAQKVADDASKSGFRVHWVDGLLSIDRTASLVAAHFQLA